MVEGGFASIRVQGVDGVPLDGTRVLSNTLIMPAARDKTYQLVITSNGRMPVPVRVVILDQMLGGYPIYDIGTKGSSITVPIMAIFNHQVISVLVYPVRIKHPEETDSVVVMVPTGPLVYTPEGDAGRARAQYVSLWENPEGFIVIFDIKKKTK